MITSRRFWAIVPTALACSLILLVTFLTAMWGQQYRLRYQAERLLQDIQSLEFQTSSYQDTHRIYDRWRSLTTSASDCTPERCEFQIELRSGYDERLWSKLQFLLFRLKLAPRPTRVRADVATLEDVLDRKGYEMGVLVGAYATPNGIFGPYELIGVTDSAKTPQELRRVSPQHPQYSVGRPGGCDGPCLEAWAYFTPQANPSDVRRLMQFDLSCVTRWRHPCRTEAEILPAAWSQYISEGGTSALSQ